MQDYDQLPVDLDLKQPAPAIDKAAATRERIIFAGIILIPILCIVIGSILYSIGLANSPQGLQVGSLPSGWSYAGDESVIDVDIPAYIGMDMANYQKGDDNIVAIMYHEASSVIESHRQDASWLRKEVETNTSFSWETSGNTEVAGCLAGYAESSEIIYGETYTFLKFYFVKEDMALNVMTIFDPYNEDEVMEIVNSINFGGEDIQPQATQQPVLSPAMSAEDAVTGFLSKLESGNIDDLKKYTALKRGRIPQRIEDSYEEFFLSVEQDMSIVILNIRIEETISTDSEVAVKAKYTVEGELAGHTFTTQKEEPFLLEKQGRDWLISQWGDIEQSPSTATPAPEPTDDPSSTGTPASTPTPTFTPTPAPQPTGEVLLSDDFNSQSDVWPIYSDMHGIVYYKDETLRVNRRGNFMSPEMCVLHKEFGDFILEAEVALAKDSQNGWILVACRTDYWGSGYHFLVSDNGKYAIAIPGKSNAREFLQEPVLSDHINNGFDVTNQLRIECVGDSIRFFINEYLLSDITDDTFSSGSLGLGIATTAGTGSAEAIFDNLKITAPVD